MDFKAAEPVGITALQMGIKIPHHLSIMGGG
jgi:polyribonucleotide nucleotidyltransferase